MVRARLGLAVIALALAWPGRAVAQYTDAPAPAAYGLRNVTMVQADGRRREGVDLVVRGRFIEAIGAGLEMPPDAEVLEGAGLVVYPGFVDAQGSAPYEFPSPEYGPRLVSWDPPRALQGFVPHRRVVDVLRATGAELAEQRRKGVVAAAVHPIDALMPGRGVLVMMRADAETPRETVITPELGPVMTFRAGPRFYPRTLFGVMAFYRQQFADARRQQEIAAMFARDPRRMTVPAYDPDYAVLQEVMAGRVPVFVVADGAEDIRRALGLADAWGFRPIIVGGREAWKVAHELERRNVPVLVSLDVPEPEFYDPAEHADHADAELDAAVLREKREFEAAWANPARLAEAGVRFALTSGGGAAELLAGARTAVKHGLDAATALRALTATPAELLGIGYLARVEAGMPATFVVTHGELFDDASQIAYTFVEGVLEEGVRVTRPDSGGAAVEVDVSGTWSVEVDSPDGPVRGTQTLRQDGAGFTGTFTSAATGEVRITDGLVSGPEITFKVQVETDGEIVELEFRGTVRGEEMTGTSSGPTGEFRFTARRTAGPGGER